MWHRSLCTHWVQTIALNTGAQSYSVLAVTQMSRHHPKCKVQSAGLVASNVFTLRVTSNTDFQNHKCRGSDPSQFCTGGAIRAKSLLGTLPPAISTGGVGHSLYSDIACKQSQLARVCAKHCNFCHHAIYFSPLAAHKTNSGIHERILVRSSDSRHSVQTASFQLVLCIQNITVEILVNITVVYH